MRRLNGRGNGKDMQDSDRENWVPLTQFLGGMLTDLGHDSEKGGEFASALQTFELAVKATPDDALAWYNYGDTLLALQRTEEALPALERAVELSPSIELYKYDLGLALYNLGRFKEAEKQFRFLVKSDPNLQRAKSHIGLSAIINLALCYGEQGQWTKAIESLKPAEALAINILYNLGRFHLHNNSNTSAARVFKAAALLGPDDENILHGAGCALMNLKQYHEAETYFQAGTKADPSCADGWYDRAINLTKIKMKKQARSCFSQVLKREPQHEGAYYELAGLDALERKRDAAFLNLKHALECGLKDVNRLRRNRNFAFLRSDPRWKAIIKRIQDLS